MFSRRRSLFKKNCTICEVSGLSLVTIGYAKKWDSQLIAKIQNSSWSRCFKQNTTELSIQNREDSENQMIDVTFTIFEKKWLDITNGFFFVPKLPHYYGSRILKIEKQIMQPSSALKIFKFRCDNMTNSWVTPFSCSVLH